MRLRRPPETAPKVVCKPPDSKITKARKLSELNQRRQRCHCLCSPNITTESPLEPGWLRRRESPQPGEETPATDTHCAIKTQETSLTLRITINAAEVMALDRNPWPTPSLRLDPQHHRLVGVGRDLWKSFLNWGAQNWNLSSSSSSFLNWGAQRWTLSSSSSSVLNWGAQHWTLSSSSSSFLKWGAQNWTLSSSFSSCFNWESRTGLSPVAPHGSGAGEPSTGLSPVTPHRS